MKAIKAIVVAVALSMVLQAGLFHASAQQSIVDRWYAALLQADRAALSELLADDATIRLDDLGVTQSKDEFIASMDEWQSAVKGAAIRHRVESEVGDTVVVLTCYDFPNNDMAMRETFTTRDGRIVANTQMTIGEDCEGI
ncbi:nuclear transport factor 2 family protein [Mesorhizobium sp. ANAO-SY3R2]|uniref:nuclear transport factor 2 family protein n=1 Tax=Mesorhizobium sp. ANAO-SY3R2 TaxID=3166644 RepID=UPI00366D851F